MHKVGSSRRKRKAVDSSEDDDDKPLFPAKLVPQATAVSPEAPPKISVSPEEPVPQTAKAVQMGDLIVTHVIKGMWKILHLGDRYYACALSNEEWMHYYGGAWTKDEFSKRNKFEGYPDTPDAKNYLFETIDDAFDNSPTMPLRPMVQKGIASRAAVHGPLGNHKIAVKSGKG